MRADKKLCDFGRTLKSYRAREDLTQAQLAEKITEVGYPIDKNHISLLEQGRRTPRPELVYCIELALNLNASEAERLREAHFRDYKMSFLSKYSCRVTKQA